MKVILEKSLENLGNKDEIVNVSDGYARNFLIPKKLALRATPNEIKQRKEKEKITQKKVKREKFKAIRIQEMLKEVTLVIERGVGEEGKLFGSVTGAEISKAITDAGVEVLKSEVRLPDGPLRELGDHEVTIQLHTDVSCDVVVVIVAEE